MQGSDPGAGPQAVKTCLEVGYVGFLQPQVPRAYKSSARQETELTWLLSNRFSRPCASLPREEGPPSQCHGKVRH